MAYVGLGAQRPEHEFCKIFSILAIVDIKDSRKRENSLLLNYDLVDRMQNGENFMMGLDGVKTELGRMPMINLSTANS
ncbi:conserved hypothetical protein [Ricinus communis]|uniref:Uncharacterized protein n=1 Tax=Ricinus communis TaxID=3988 RepID=B9S349_RICCO|nr:conserved hypothetical protein [Ricinus communis]